MSSGLPAQRQPCEQIVVPCTGEITLRFKALPLRIQGIEIGASTAAESSTNIDRIRHKSRDGACQLNIIQVTKKYVISASFGHAATERGHPIGFGCRTTKPMTRSKG